MMQVYEMRVQGQLLDYSGAGLGAPELNLDGRVPHVTRTVCIGVRETSARCKETIRIADGTYLHDSRYEYSRKAKINLAFCSLIRNFAAV